MARIALSVPTVLLNNIPIVIVPNSFEFEPGYGEVNVRGGSTGGGTSTSIHTENAESKIGKCKFKAFVTDETRGVVSLAKTLTAANVVSAIQADQTPIVLNGASMTNNPVFAANADGSTDLEFSGDPTPTP
jgi:hypothetical protein